MRVQGYIAGVAALALLCGSCARTAQGQPSKSAVRLRTAALTGLTSVDWDVKLYWLDPSPPQMFNETTSTSVLPGGEWVTILPCLTSPSGTGLDQVQVQATLHFAGQAPMVLTGAAVFTCVANSDTRVNLVLSSASATSNGGFGDLDTVVSGVKCADKVDFKGDGYLAVCASASCGDAFAVFLFANACQTLSGAPPVFWACGPATDWTIAGMIANSQFPVPARDGAWEFSVAAMDPFRMEQADPTLTDASGNLRVWSGLLRPTATLVKQGGLIAQSSIDRTRTSAFAAQLELPPATLGAGTPQLLLEIRNDAPGVSAWQWTPFGPCEVPVQGTASDAGLFAIDLRLVSPSQAKVVLATAPAGLASKSAICTMARNPDNTTSISCAAPGAL